MQASSETFSQWYQALKKFSLKSLGKNTSLLTKSARGLLSLPFPLKTRQGEGGRGGGETSESSRSFASSKNPHFQNEAKWTTFLVRNSCIYMRIKNRITYSRFDTEARRNSKKACF